MHWHASAKNTISDNGTLGVRVSGASDASFAGGNVLRGNAVEALLVDEASILALTNNEVVGNGTRLSAQLAVTGESQAVLEGNVIADGRGFGLKLQSGSAVYVQSNRIQGNRSAGICIIGGDEGGSDTALKLQSHIKKSSRLSTPKEGATRRSPSPSKARRSPSPDDRALSPHEPDSAAVVNIEGKMRS